MVQKSMGHYKAVQPNFTRFVKSVSFIMLFRLKWKYQKPCLLRTLGIVDIETSSVKPASRNNVLCLKGPIFDLILRICLPMFCSSLSESFFGLPLLSFSSFAERSINRSLHMSKYCCKAFYWLKDRNTFSTYRILI